MGILEWSEKFSVNISEIDEQHKVLFRCINDLVEAIQTFQEKDALVKVMDELVRYTNVHFSEEEELMKKYSYPEYENHVKEHEKFVGMVEDMRKKYEMGEQTISLQVLDFMVDWLKTHIMGTDMKYAPYLNERGVV